MTCSDCVHFDVCEHAAYDGEYEDEEILRGDCKHFKLETDFVEVVRCKDCRRWGGKNKDFGMCHCLCSQTEKNDFCSYGKRKDGAAE